MLFDLKGRRRRVVQVTYVSLAILMGAGLVLFGIGGEVSGGLVDGLSGGGNSGESDIKKQFDKQIEQAEKALQANPRDQAALATLVRARFGRAATEQQEQDGVVVGYSDKGLAELKQAEEAWGRYLATNPERIDTGLAATAIQIYNVLGPPTDPRERERYVRPAREIAEQTNTADAYINLLQVATRAGDTRTAALAERKALTFAESKDERAIIRERIKAAKAAASATDPAAGANGAAPTGP